MRRSLLSLVLAAASAGSAGSAFAQVRTVITPRVSVYTVDSSDPNRAMLGVSTASDGRRDTLGVLVTSVTEGSPAEKAGIEEGNRIASINGVNLKLSRADAGESDMTGVMPNRLSREMRKLKPGDEATLEIWGAGKLRTAKVKTVAADVLLPARRTRESDDERAALGLFVSSTGSKRDTLGVFVSGVSEEGPAEKAGINEGDRIASINGIDLKTPREDIGEGWMASSRAQRLQREIAKLRPGQTADLAVVSGGRSHTVKVTAVRASDLKGREGFSFRIGDVPNAAVINGAIRDAMRGVESELRSIRPQIRMELDRELPRAMDEARRSLERVRIESPVARVRVIRRVTI